VQNIPSKNNQTLFQPQASASAPGFNKLLPSNEEDDQMWEYISIFGNSENNQSALDVWQ
jgi:hypothetical protein